MRLAALLCIVLAPMATQAQESSAPAAASPTVWASMQQKVESSFAYVNDHLAKVFFFDVLFGYGGSVNVEIDGASKTIERTFPAVVFVLVVGGVFFTFRYGWVNIRLFRHALDVVRGHYDHPDHEGEISHFKALTSALSATIGLGNIAGVAVAISQGGPGAVFWMWMTAIFGMSMKFSCCTLAQLHRRIKPNGTVLGGPMIYMAEGLPNVFGPLILIAKPMAVLFATLTIFASFGGGNLFQVNQTYSLFEQQFLGGDARPLYAWVVGIVLAIPVALVILGGIRRIGEVTSRMVPMMCVFYMFVCFIIVLLNLAHIPGTFAHIFSEAFSAQALYGGFLGVMVAGMKRAAFSNEAGIGSAAIAHAAAKTDEPVREGVVAMLGPFIDTIMVCTMTALAILVTDAHIKGAHLEGIEITALAFAQFGTFLPFILFAAVFVFAFSTIISWGYYGERASEYLFGPIGIVPYRVVYVLVVVIGPVLSLKQVVNFADLMLLGMAFPNIFAMLFLSGEVRALTKDYVRRLKSGEMKRYA